MLNNPIFYFATIHKLTAAFGTLFNEIYIARTTDGNTNQVIRVPLTYAPKNKLLLRADQDPDATKMTAITLPHMAFEMMPDFQYDGTRRQPPLEKFVVKDASFPNKLKRQYIPVPYNINYNLYVYVNNLMDGQKIIEQIIPFFTPDWTVSINHIPEMGLAFDTPIILKSVQMDDNHFDQQFVERRVLVWTLSFVVKTYFLGPIKSKPIIKFAHERFYFSETVEEQAGTSNVNAQSIISVTPGLTANGEPTSNSAITVDANTIYVDNDFGFIEAYTNGPIRFEGDVWNI